MRIVNAVKYLTYDKIRNFCGLYRQYRRLRRHKPVGWLLPPSFLTFEPTNECNLHCPCCPTGAGSLTRPKGCANVDMFKSLIDNNKRQLINVLLHFQGEPLLHSDLGTMISYARENRVFTEFSTNGQLLADNIDMIKSARPDKIIVSLDGLTQETYEKYRVGGDVNKVFDALQKLSQLPTKIRPFVVLQFLVFKHNEHEIGELRKLKRKYKIDRLILKTAQIYSAGQVGMLPTATKYSRYDAAAAPLTLKYDLPDCCRRIVFGSVITWQGDVVPCCYDKNADFKCGNITNDALVHIRNNDKYQLFVNQVFSHRQDVYICKNCNER